MGVGLQRLCGSGGMGGEFFPGCGRNRLGEAFRGLDFPMRGLSLLRRFPTRYILAGAFMSSSVFGLTSSEFVVDESGATLRPPILVGVGAGGERYPALHLRETPQRIGRHPRAHLVIAHPGVSKFHLEVQLIGPVVFVRDLESTNGTFVNGRRISGLTPIGPGDEVRVGTVTFQVDCSPAGPGESVEIGGRTELSLDHWIKESLDELAGGGGLHVVFQPIVTIGDNRTAGFEALIRSRIAGLEAPEDLFRFAARSNVAERVSHTCRMMAATDARHLPGACPVFLNTIPEEVLDRRLLSSLQDLRDAFPNLPVVVEIHEKCVTEPLQLRSFVHQLDELDMKLAFDDFGAGNSRLQDLLYVRPEYIKFDHSLVYGMHLRRGRERDWMRSLVQSIRDLGVQTVAEGVESQASFDACCEMGFDLVQGFAIGIPKQAREWSLPTSTQRDTREEMSTLTE
jgi:EAL domain-containing protein (putative c-di-GMP-specific phosphodiesterase class I)